MRQLSLLLALAMLVSGSVVQATSLRVAAWNTFNRPNGAGHEAWFTTVFQAIGNETVEGVARRIDVLAVSETDTGSAQDLVDLLNDLYSVSSYSVITSSSNGGDRTGIVYDTSSIQLLGSTELVTGLTHPIMRAQFQVVPTNGGATFYLYSIHLKSGNSAATRADEVDIIRADADGLGEGENIIYAGDFNMYGSSEGAWTGMGDFGNGQAFDVASSPGEWRENAVFSALHTQNPGAAMDDRFDMMPSTGELFDGTGLEYVPDSYRVFGNDGSHTFNGAITSGTGAPSNILTALANASDHLPIVADYVEAPELSSGLLLIAGFPIAVIAMAILASRHVRPDLRSTCGIPSFALAPGRRDSDG